MKIIAASTTEHSLGKNNAETLKKKKNTSLSTNISTGAMMIILNQLINTTQTQ